MIVLRVLPSRFKVALVQPASYGPLLLGWARQLIARQIWQMKNVRQRRISLWLNKLKIEINNNFFKVISS
jgi:hypothetical protein